MTDSNDRLVATSSQTVGPFFHFGLATDPLLGQMTGPRQLAIAFAFACGWFDGAGEPLPDALVELWQADAGGRYVEQPDHADADPGQAFRGWGRLPTSASGECEFATIRPGATTAGDGRPAGGAHQRVSVFPRDHAAHLHAHLLRGRSDARGGPGAGPGARGSPPHADRTQADGMWAFDIHLQGDRETVFFDL